MAGRATQAATGAAGRTAEDPAWVKDGAGDGGRLDRWRTRRVVAGRWRRGWVRWAMAVRRPGGASGRGGELAQPGPDGGESGAPCARVWESSPRSATGSASARRLARAAGSGSLKKSQVSRTRARTSGDSLSPRNADGAFAGRVTQTRDWQPWTLNSSVRKRSSSGGEDRARSTTAVSRSWASSMNCSPSIRSCWRGESVMREQS